MMDDDLEVEALLRSDNEEDIEIKQVNLNFGMVSSINHNLNEPRYVISNNWTF